MQEIPRRKMSDSEIIEIIIQVVGDYFNLTGAQMFAKTRKREIVTPRQMCHKLAWKYTKYNQTVIGEKMGKLDRSTLCNSCKRISNFCMFDKKIRWDYNIINEGIEKAIKRGATKRKSGYYRVKVYGEWEIAEWDEKCNAWYFISFSDPSNDSILDEIGEKIERNL